MPAEGVEVLVREGRRADVDALVAFNAAMARESEGRELDEARLRRGVEGLLAREAAGFYLVAEAAGETVGALMVTSEWSDWRAGMFWWIQSVYVVGAWRRRGVYRALHAAVRSRAREAGGVCGLRLYVERDNASARATYEALGMTETAYRLYEETWGG